MICKSLQFTLAHSTSQSFHTPYYNNNTQICFTDKYRDLGIIINDKLSWSDHCNPIFHQAYASHHLICCIVCCPCPKLRRHLYISLARSHLSYCSQLCRPHLINDISHIEQVQRHAKIILHDYLSNYRSRLTKLELLPLMYYLKQRDITFFIKCVKEPTANFNIHDMCLPQIETDLLHRASYSTNLVAPRAPGTSISIKSR